MSSIGDQLEPALARLALGRMTSLGDILERMFEEFDELAGEERQEAAKRFKQFLEANVIPRIATDSERLALVRTSQGRRLAEAESRLVYDLNDLVVKLAALSAATIDFSVESRPFEELIRGSHRGWSCSALEASERVDNEWLALARKALPRATLKNFVCVVLYDPVFGNQKPSRRIASEIGISRNAVEKHIAAACGPGLPLKTRRMKEAEMKETGERCLEDTQEIAKIAQETPGSLYLIVNGRRVLIAPNDPRITGEDWPEENAK